MTRTAAPTVAGIGTVPNGTYSIPSVTSHCASFKKPLRTLRSNSQPSTACICLLPRPWTPQGSFSTYLLHLLGLDVDRSVEVSTGERAERTRFTPAVSDIRDGTVETALVLAVERNSIVETTGPYFDYILKSFDTEFESPIGMTVPAAYAQSMQRYLYEYGIARRDLADIVVKNRTNGVANPDGLFDESLSQDDVLDARLISTLSDCLTAPPLRWRSRNPPHHCCKQRVGFPTNTRSGNRISPHGEPLSAEPRNVDHRIAGR